MNDEHPPPDRRIPLFARATVLLIVVCTVSLGVIVVSARATADYRCLEFGPYNVFNPLNRNISLMDTVTQRVLSENRPQAQEPISFSTAPNGRTILFLARERPKDTLLTLYTSAVTTGIAPDQVEYGRPVPLQRGLSFDRRIVVTGMPTEWSSDNRQVAYLSTDDDQLVLHMVNVDGSNPRSSVFEHPLGLAADTVNLDVHSWSPDDRWVVLSEHRLSGAQFSLFWLYDAATGQRAAWSIENNQFLRGDWNPDPKITQFAALTEDRNGGQRLVFWSPGQVITTSITGDIYDIDWSPDGRYLALRLRHCPTGSACVWDYLVLNSTDGSIVQQGFDAVSGSPLDNPTIQFNGLWTASSDEWVYLRANQTDQPTLVARRISDGRERTLVEHVVNELATGILQYSTTYFPEPSRRFVPRDQKLIVPSWQANGIRLEIMDIDGGNRVLLTEGIPNADRIIDSGARQLGISRWWPFGVGTAIATWVDRSSGQPQTHLAIATPDGKVHREVILDTPNIQLMALTPGGWLVYAPSVGSDRFFEALNVYAEKPVRLAQVGTTVSWHVAGNSQTQTLAVQVGVKTIYLLAPSDTKPVPLNVLRTNSTWLTWSQDGSKLALTRFDAIIAATLVDVYSPDGTLIQESNPIQTPGYLNLEAIRWTRCD